MAQTDLLKIPDAESVERIIRLGENIDSPLADYRLVNLLGYVGDYIGMESEDAEEINSYLPRRFEVAITFEDAIVGDLYSEKHSLDLGMLLGTCAQ